MTTFTGKRIVLTGATGGIGTAIAEALSMRGASLILIGRNQDKLDALNSQLGGKHQIVVCDISNEQQRQDLVRFCQQAPYNVDILINNAGISEFNLLENTDARRITELININLTSPILLCQAFIPLLKKASSARIVNIGSTFGRIGFAGFSVYSSSKFGLRGFSEALRRELADSSIGVTYFAPRATKTDLNSSDIVAMNAELGNTMDPADEVAQAFVQCLSSSKAEYYYGWPEKLFVCINSVLPSLVDKSLLKKLPIIKRYL